MVNVQSLIEAPYAGGFFGGGEGVKIIYELFDRPSIVYMVRLSFYVQVCIYKSLTVYIDILVLLSQCLSKLVDTFSNPWSLIT